ncbi:MAG: glycosyltransferase [Clostridiales bacterium]|nr:glycosyltransferase [Clostridiales bacterium]
MNNLTKNIILAPFNLLYKVSPALTLKLLFRLKQGYPLDLRSPKTYNEKLQWIKLYGRNPLMPKCCDKYTVRQFVEDRGCGDILNRLIWQGFDPKDIPFDALPEKYVVKVTHGSTFNIIQDGTKAITREEIIEKCEKWLKARFLPCYGEWFYGIEKPRVIVEDFIESCDDAQLRDYKVFCFNGIPRMIRVDTDRFTGHKTDLFDTDWNMIEGVELGFPSSGRTFERPACLEALLERAAQLSKPFHHARVDFYITGDRFYFGEITFMNGAGFDRFSSYDFDLKMGSWLDLTK